MTYSCGHCGATFETKGAKHRHKSNCPGPAAPDGGEDTDDQWLHSRLVLRPEIKARADAEWAAMDERGKLPDGWEYRA